MTSKLGLSYWKQSFLKFLETVTVKNQRNFSRLQFHVKYFAKPFCGNATLLSPVFYFNKVRKFRVQYWVTFHFRVVLCKHTFNICISNIVWYFFISGVKIYADTDGVIIFFLRFLYGLSIIFHTIAWPCKQHHLAWPRGYHHIWLFMWHCFLYGYIS